MKLTKRQVEELTWMTRSFHDNTPGSQIDVYEVAEALENLVVFIIENAEIVDEDSDDDKAAGRQATGYYLNP